MRDGVEVVKFRVGDKVRVREDLEAGKRYGRQVFVDSMKRYRGEVTEVVSAWNDGYHLSVGGWFWEFTDEMLEPIEDPLATKIEERNNKPVKMILDENLLNDNDPIKPAHYKTGDKDLFDELYDRLYHSKKTFTGREVFIIVMKFVAERYTRRYPNKNAEDLSKGIYTLERLRGYEELEK